MLGRIANDWNQDHSNKGLADLHALDGLINAPDEIPGANRNKHGQGDADNCDGHRAKLGLLSLVSFLIGVLAPRFKEITVGATRECQVRDVE